ncbi:MAG: DUF1553 domain-containing protein [Verrucomicrobiales bacterium]|nr:DUF1553 domain-containing protein [Verrucomicrobiales bacterium]
MLPGFSRATAAVLLRRRGRVSKAIGLAFAAWFAGMGARGNPTATPPGFTPEQKSHWAFRPVGDPPVPKTSESDAARGPVDAFWVERLHRAGIRPGPEADRITLIRRLSLDLTGLPPTSEEVDRFVDDASPRAYEAVVERLLASPHYGERWARHWLDVARYADSEGFKADETRPHAWRYRDYVIRAFSEDKPYDRFVLEQIAGDELWPGDLDATVATGFNRHYPDESNARNLVQRRQEILNDITDTVGYAFVGLTYACARCHDHKWDPITQADYFRLQAFFANTAAFDSVPLAPAPERARHAERLAAWQAATRDIREELECIEAPARKAILDDYVEKYPAEIQAMLAKPAKERSPFEQHMVAKAGLYLDPASPQYLAPSSAVGARLKGDTKARWSELRAMLKDAAGGHPGELPLGTAMMDLGAGCPPTHILRRGLWNAPEESVDPGFLSVLGRERAEVSPVPSGTSGRRAALARILVDPRNPLTARVMVNRIWHHHFGRGLVGTPNDFGMKGDAPSHPELLDWLARDFVAHGWSVKHVHRRIVMSSAYRQSSRHRADAALVDPANRLLWKYPRHRLEGEAIRDGLLSVSGRLNSKRGGPGVFPELPKGMESRGGWPVSAEVDERDRRSVYVFVRRNTRYPMFEAFDMPDTHESCARRNVTTSPVQALTLLNSTVVWDLARSFAARVLGEAGNDSRRQIEVAWRHALSRLPEEEERISAGNFLAAQRERVGSVEAARAGSSLPPHPLAESDPAGAAALTDLCHALMNANEFVYVN